MLRKFFMKPSLNGSSKLLKQVGMYPYKSRALAKKEERKVLSERSNHQQRFFLCWENTVPWRMGNIPCSENGLTMRKIGFIVVIVIIPDLRLVIIN